MINLKKLKQSSLDGLKTKNFKIGGYSVVATVIVIAIAIVINILAAALPSNITQLDTTSAGLFSISKQTKELVSGLDEDVSIYWIVQEGQEDETLELLLNRYENLGSKLDVSKKDPDVYPTFAQQYTDSDSIYNNSLVVECGDKYRFVSYEDIYVYDYSDYYTSGTYDVSFAGESKITSAINYVTSDSMPTLYTLTGHGEASLSSDFASAIADANIETEEISLLTLEAVPEDAGCVLIYAPSSDISETELEMLQSYLAEGGNLFYISNPLEDNAHLENIESLMAGYGVTANEGIVIEADQNYYIYSQPYYLLPELGSHDITQALAEDNYYVLLPVAQGLSVSDTEDDGISVTQLLTTSTSSFSKLAGYSLETYEKEEDDIDGPFALAVAITEDIDDETQSKIVWVSSAALLDDDTNYVVSGGNQDFFLNSLSWMCAGEDNISIHAKSVSYDSLTIDSAAASSLSAIMVAVIPALVLAAGIYVTVRRKRR